MKSGDKENNNLTLLQQEVLDILRQLDHCCEVAELNEEDITNGLVITFGDIDFSVLEKRPDDLSLVEKSLQKDGLDFSITFDIQNKDPEEYVQSGEYFEVDQVPIGIIKGKNIKTLRLKINSIIKGLNNEGELSKNKMDNVSDDVISIGNLGIEIKGLVIFRGSEKCKINPTDRKILDYLYERHEKNQKTRTKKDDLAIRFRKEEKYIANRISEMNKKVKKLALCGVGKSNIDYLIKNEKDRGFYLNPYFVIKST